MPGLSKELSISVGTCTHGLPCCPHTITGVLFKGSSDSKVEGSGAGRFMDLVSHSCPHCGIGFCSGASSVSKINGMGAHLVGQTVTLPGGSATTVTGSSKAIAS